MSVILYTYYPPGIISFLSVVVRLYTHEMYNCLDNIKNKKVAFLFFFEFFRNQLLTINKF